MMSHASFECRNQSSGRQATESSDTKEGLGLIGSRDSSRVSGQPLNATARAYERDPCLPARMHSILGFRV